MTEMHAGAWREHQLFHSWLPWTTSVSGTSLRIGGLMRLTTQPTAVGGSLSW
jgi:hypothetical protein